MRQGREKKNDILVINVGERKYQKKKNYSEVHPVIRPGSQSSSKGYKVKDTVYKNM